MTHRQVAFGNLFYKVWRGDHRAGPSGKILVSYDFTSCPASHPPDIKSPYLDHTMSNLKVFQNLNQEQILALRGVDPTHEAVQGIVSLAVSHAVTPPQRRNLFGNYPHLQKTMPREWQPSLRLPSTFKHGPAKRNMGKTYDKTQHYMAVVMRSSNKPPNSACVTTHRSTFNKRSMKVLTEHMASDVFCHGHQQCQEAPWKISVFWFSALYTTSSKLIHSILYKVPNIPKAHPLHT